MKLKSLSSFPEINRNIETKKDKKEIKNFIFLSVEFRSCLFVLNNIGPLAII